MILYLIPIKSPLSVSITDGFLLIAPIIAMLNFRYWILLIKAKGKWNYNSATKRKEFSKIKIAFDRIQEKFN